MDFVSGKALLDICAEENLSISEVMIRRETELFGVSRAECDSRMKNALAVMRESISEAKRGNTDVLGGYIGGECRDYLGYIRQCKPIGGMISRVDRVDFAGMGRSIVVIDKIFTTPKIYPKKKIK